MTGGAGLVAYSSFLSLSFTSFCMNYFLSLFALCVSTGLRMDQTFSDCLSQICATRTGFKQSVKCILEPAPSSIKPMGTINNFSRGLPLHYHAERTQIQWWTIRDSKSLSADLISIKITDLCLNIYIFIHSY